MEVQQIPIWLLATIAGLILSLIAYVWHALESRMNKVEFWREGCMSKGQILTVSDHAEFCKKERETMVGIVKQEFTDFERLMDLKFKNLELVIKQNGNKGSDGGHQE